MTHRPSARARVGRRPARLSSVLGLALGGACLVASACQSGGVSPEPAAESAAPERPPGSVEPEVRPEVEGKPERFGGAFVAGPEVPLPQILSSPGEYAGQAVITEGQVRRACTRKGCWMEINQGEDACRVTFKDYGFFVPRDSAGASARLQGTVQTRVVDAADVRHLESEGAHFKNKNADGSATEVRMVATAVELTR